MPSNAAHTLYHAPLSSYESLDKFNCASETLKISDDYHQKKHNIINTMSHNPAYEIISTTNKSEVKMASPSINNNYKLMNSLVDDDNDYSRNSSLRRQSNNNDDIISMINVADAEVASNKQKHLSDWYYIKTSPKPKPASPYERRKVKNFLQHPTMKSAPVPLLLPSSDSFINQNSSERISSLHDNDNDNDNEFIPIQKYRSNDYIEHPPHHQIHFHEDKSPMQTYKCFSMKYSKNPSGRNSETKFGEMTSSSFEHVNITGLHDNRFSESDLRNDDYVQSLRIAAARMRPLPQAPKSANNQESQVC